MFTKTFIFFLSIFIGSNIFSQSIEGIYKGTGNADDGEHCNFELTVHLNDSVLTGATYLLFPNNKFQRFSIAGVFDKNDSTLFFKETKRIDSKSGIMINCFGTYHFKVHRIASAFVITGTSANYTRLFKILCANATFFITKPIDTLIAVSAKPDSANIVSLPQTTVLSFAERKNEKITTIVSQFDTVHLTLYDNGIIDHDSVSLYLNDSLIIYKKELSATGFAFDIYLDKNIPSNRLLFVAENLGDIPPNTGVMMIDTKQNQYQVNLAADFSTNSLIEFELKQ